MMPRRPRSGAAGHGGGRRRPPSRGHHPERTRDIRWIYLHMIEEYARRNGHTDLIRELIDGVTGE